MQTLLTVGNHHQHELHTYSSLPLEQASGLGGEVINRTVRVEKHRKDWRNIITYDADTRIDKSLLRLNTQYSPSGICV